MKRKYNFIIKNEDLLQESCEAQVMSYEIGPIELKDNDILSEINLSEMVKFETANAVQLKKLLNGHLLVEVLEKFISKITIPENKSEVRNV